MALVVDSGVGAKLTRLRLMAARAAGILRDPMMMDLRGDLSENLLHIGRCTGKNKCLHNILLHALSGGTWCRCIDPKPDMFGIIPGDTDYRIFAEDITNIPGLDIIFVLGGYFYHTSYDTLENLLPGSIQARGENLFNLVKAFTNPMLLKENEISNKAAKDGIEDVGAVFFDYLTWFMDDTNWM
ncbi:Endoplasmic reticulum metallopeptidase 1 [Zea mays]|uniref:Endoplasmic reticulum metallopeptidase 1 n=1 Tax=Zea mays TaxID=4577 RepID=A0A3L6E4H3_MAIZE|nr:Endoplasmic reticulum metallopeptidase 1 [Zea mays]